MIAQAASGIRCHGVDQLLHRHTRITPHPGYHRDPRDQARETWGGWRNGMVVSAFGCSIVHLHEPGRGPRGGVARPETARAGSPAASLLHRGPAPRRL